MDRIAHRSRYLGKKGRRLFPLFPTMTDVLGFVAIPGMATVFLLAKIEIAAHAHVADTSLNYIQKVLSDTKPDIYGKGFTGWLGRFLTIFLNCEYDT